MSWAEDLETGKEGERIVRSLLESSGNIKSIIDCSNDKYFQDKDIDFMAEMIDGKVVKYEVKTDTKAHETGNIVWEHTSSGNVGCLARCEADCILYYLRESGALYWFWTQEMRKYIESTKPRLIKMADKNTGYLLNIHELLKKGTIKRI